jgi:tetratricopeptide (TPR) repeat protein
MPRAARGWRLSYIRVQVARMIWIPRILPCLAFALLLHPQSAGADDWEIRRSDFDPRIITRYKGMLARSPNDGYALGKLISLYKKHKTLAALIGEYKAAAKGAPHSFALQVILGHLYRRSGSTELAVKHYEAAAAINPKSPTVPGALGALYQKLGRTADAAEAYKKALALSGSSVRDKKQHLRSLANLALAERNLSEARRYYDQLVALEPKNLFLRIELAQALAKSGLEKEAIEQYQNILKRTGDSSAKADVLKEIGALQAKLGKEKEAIATYQKAMALTAGGHWLRRELTDRIIAIYRQKEDLKTLIAEYEKSWQQRRGYFENDVLGRLYDETGDEAKALKAYRAALKSQPQAIDTRVRLISLLERSGHDKEVLAEYRKLVQIAPGDPKYPLELAKRLHRNGQQKEAIAILDGCAARFAGDASVQAALADLFQRWGDQKRAMKAAQLLVSIEPKDPSHIINLGEQQFLQGKKKQAIETWKRLLAVIPQKHAAYARLAEIYGQHEMTKEAVELYRKAIKLSPQNIPYRRELALLLERKQQTMDALRSWEEVRMLAGQLARSDTKREARAHIIEILHRTYQLRHRLTAYHFVFDTAQPDLEAGFFLAEAYAKLGEIEKAAAVYRRILQLQRTNLEALAALEVTYRKQRKLAAAVELLKRMAELQPARARELYQQVADLLLQLYRDKEALAYAQRAVALGPQDASSYQRLGELFEKKEDYAGAMKAYTRAIQLDPTRIRVHFALARLHSQQGANADAEKLYRQVVKTAKTPETVQKAFRLAIELSSFLGMLDTLEKEMLPLSVTSQNSETYRRLLVELYKRRVPILIDQVRRGSPAVRERARKELHQIGVRGLAPLLEELATQPNPSRRLIRMLGYLGNPNAVVPLLRVAEKEPQEEVTTIYGSTTGGYSYGYPYYYSPYRYSKMAAIVNRRVEATVAIGRIADARGVPGLVRLLASREGTLPEAAAWALSRIKDPRAQKALWHTLGDPRQTVQMMACAGLGAQGSAELRIRDVIEEVMLDRDRRGRVRAACAWGLGALGSAKSSDALVQMLQAGDDDIQRVAAWSLGAIGDRRTLGPVVRAIWNKRDEVRRALVWALVQITSGQKQGRAAAAATPDISIRDGRIDDEEFVSLLAAEVDELQGGALAKQLAAVLAAHQTAISEGLEAALGRHRDVLLRVLTDLDASKDALALGPLTSGREQLPPAARAGLDRAVATVCGRLAPRLAQLIDHRDPLIRQRAVSVYAKLAPRDLLARLRHALADQRWEVRVAALEALAAAHRRATIRILAPQTALREDRITRDQVLERASPGLKGSHWRERESAARVLGQLGHPGAAAALAAALRDGNGFVRQAAAVALGRCGGGDAAARALIAALGDEVPHVRAAACAALAQLKAAEARRHVAPLLADPSAAVQRAAQRALQQLP